MSLPVFRLETKNMELAEKAIFSINGSDQVLIESPNSDDENFSSDLQRHVDVKI